MVGLIVLLLLIYLQAQFFLRARVDNRLELVIIVA